MNSQYKLLGYYTAITIVIANMVGTGVFTSLGYQVVNIHDGTALLTLWVVGGLIALCGALSYSELAAALPRSGGEYHYLGRIYHPILGTVTGWVSVIIGFSAPVALASMALGSYAASFTSISPMWTAMSVVIAVTLFHAFNVSIGQRFHIVTTILKILIIVVFIGAGLFAVPTGDAHFSLSSQSIDSILSPAFAVSLIYVSYAYLGWNAATYIASEIENPQLNIPRALLRGTITVTVFYLALNYVFLRTVPLSELAGKIEIGALSASQIFGQTGGVVMSMMLCVLLISTISAMVFTGPRVIQSIGEDNPSMAGLAVKSSNGAPMRAIFLQQAIALIFIATDSFEVVLTFAGFILTLFALLTVLGVFILRYTEPELHRPYRTWGYPYTPAIFITLSIITLVFVLQERPLIGIAAIMTIALSMVFVLVNRK